MTRDGKTRQEGAQVDERELGISNRQKLIGEQEYFHMLLCDLRIYSGQTKGDCGKIVF